MKACLTKWIPPRADFVNTTTDTERDLLQQHSDWLNAMMADGLIVAHGPVMDPAGSYGVALWRIADDQILAAVLAQDPIVRAGVGHYEQFSMMHVSARG
jgi:uncharacterized protein YciI